MYVSKMYVSHKRFSEREMDMMYVSKIYVSLDVGDLKANGVGLFLLTKMILRFFFLPRAC